MANKDLLCKIWCVLSVLGGVELRARKGIIEDTGDPGWDAEASYLDYEEPEYNQSRGFTKDDFTDNLQGYQTQPSIARSFGWGMPGFGELPFAALLANHDRLYQRNRFCMGTVITTLAVVTPCACVRNLGEYLHSDLWEKETLDAWYRLNKFRPPDFTYKYYQYKYSIGLAFDIIANHIEYIEDNVGKGIYPQAKDIIVDQCWTTWSYFPAEGRSHDGYNRYRQLFHPAIVLLSKKLEVDTVCPWPPFELNYKYYNGTYYGSGRETINFFYSNALEEGKPTSAIVSSYKFTPLEEIDLSMDNDGRGAIKTEDRLVNLRVELCNQNLCNTSESFERLNSFWTRRNKLNDMLCWCDVPWVGDEVVYRNMKIDEEAPIYVQSVYGGLIGAPVIHNGLWLGWTVETVSRKVAKGALRSIWTRNVDAEMIAFFEKKLPELKNRKRRFNSDPDDDVHRRSFAVHDFKDFVPDADMKKEDLDLQGWAQIGEPRFLQPRPPNRYGRRRERSAASAILPTLVLSLLGIFLILP